MQISTLLLLIALVLTLGLGSTTAWAVTDNQEAICDQPYVIFCDNFEARALGTGDWGRATYKNGGWQGQIQGPTNDSPGVAAGVNPDGTNGHQFQLHQGAGSTSGYSGYEYGWFTQPMQEVYIRWYTKWSPNWVAPSGQEKHAGVNHASPLWGCCNLGNKINTSSTGSRAGATVEVGIKTGVTPVDHSILCTPSYYNPAGFVNDYDLCFLPSFAYQNNQWYCMEFHLKWSSAEDYSASGDGLVEAWVDGVQQISAFNLNTNYVLPPGQQTFDQMNFYARLNCYDTDGMNCVQADGITPDPSYYHPEQFRWHDNVVVGTQRIGCLGTPPPPSATPPAAPNNLRVSSLWDQLLKAFSTLAGLLG